MRKGTDELRAIFAVKSKDTNCKRYVDTCRDFFDSAPAVVSGERDFFDIATLLALATRTRTTDFAAEINCKQEGTAVVSTL